MRGFGHSLWGVWVEIGRGAAGTHKKCVTPFGECGLKSKMEELEKKIIGHSLWGVWVEIPDDYTSSYADMSLPLGSVG